MINLDIFPSETDSLLATTLHYLEKPRGVQNLVLKPGIKSIDWGNKFQDLPKEAYESRKILSHTSQAFSWIALPKKITNLGKSYTLMNASQGTGAFCMQGIGTFKDFMTVVRVGTTSLEVAHEDSLIALSARQLAILDGVGFLSCLAVVMKNTRDLKENFDQLCTNSPWERAFNLALIKIIYKVCAITTGIFGMITFAFGGGLIAKSILLTVSTTSLALSISKYYCKRL